MGQSRRIWVVCNTVAVVFTDVRKLRILTIAAPTAISSLSREWVWLCATSPSLESIGECIGESLTYAWPAQAKKAFRIDKQATACLEGNSTRSKSS